jgi:hypothetical protein
LAVLPCTLVLAIGGLRGVPGRADSEEIPGFDLGHAVHALGEVKNAIARAFVSTQVNEFIIGVVCICRDVTAGGSARVDAAPQRQKAMLVLIGPNLLPSPLQCSVVPFRVCTAGEIADGVPLAHFALPGVDAGGLWADVGVALLPLGARVLLVLRQVLVSRCGVGLHNGDLNKKVGVGVGEKMNKCRG